MAPAPPPIASARSLSAFEPTFNAWRAAASRATHPSARDECEPLIVAIARGLAAVSTPWELGTGDAPSERCYELLLSTDVYDAWLIHWPAGTGLDAHDDGESTGAFAIVAGELDEDTAFEGVVTTRRFGEGNLVWFDEGHVHAVVNRGDVGATSVHVYSPPLRTMSFYSAGPEGEMVVERVDDVEGVRG